MMFTRFSYEEVMAAAPETDVIVNLWQSINLRDQALYLAICSLERIAGADSPDGGNPETDALRALSGVRRLLRRK